ncbi:MAG: ATP-binding protein [Pyrinomonadaceae bacterium]
MRLIQSMEVHDEAQVGTVRRAVHSFARGVGFTERELAELDIVVQEIGTNAVRYADGGGWIHFTSPLGAEPGIEIFYSDKGPGISDLERAIRDGVSSGGGLGAGLGAIQRLMDEFEVYSTVKPAKIARSSRHATPSPPSPSSLSSPLPPRPSRSSSASLSSASSSAPSRAAPAAASGHASRRTTHGTALLGRKWIAAARLSPERHAATARRIGVWSRPHPGETDNGDAYFVRRRSGQQLLAVVDGLGHGAGAREAADAALEILSAWQGEPLEDVFRRAHERLRPTRGAVMGACVLDARAQKFHFAGVGNVEVRVVGSPAPVRPVSANGTLGSRLGAVRVFSYDWSEGATVLLASDGLSATWDIEDYPGLLAKSPQMIAGVLARDYSRETDDATVLVAR